MSQPDQAAKHKGGEKMMINEETMTFMKIQLSLHLIHIMGLIYRFNV